MIDSKTANFYDLSTKVRINPETFLKFEDGENVILQNIASEQSVRIKYDILLILYPMTHWITVGELCEGWPPEDQQKIKEHLEMLYQAKIVVTEEAEIPEKPQSSLPAHLGNEININIENHHNMLRDSIRMAAYQRAIERAVTPASVVLDLGAGSGILSFFAAKAQASHIYAIEKRPDMVSVAKILAEANHFADRITFVQNSSHQVSADLLDPKPTVLVAEILGNAILEERVLEFTIDARDRFLAPGGKLIPGQLDIMLVAFDTGMMVDRAQEVAELETMYGLNLEILKTVLAQKPTLKLERFAPQTHQIMSKPVCVIQLDLATITSPLFRQRFDLIPTQDGYINGFCMYFKAHLDEETVLTNSPWAPSTHWTQMVYYFPSRRTVKAQEVISMELAYDGGLNLWYTEDWPDA